MLLLWVLWGLGLLSTGAGDAVAEGRWNPGASVETVRVIFAGGERRTLELEGRRLDNQVDVLYLSSAHIASVARAGRFWRESSMALRLSVAGRDAILTHGSLSADADGREVMLSAPPYAQEGDLWLPVTVCPDLLASLAGEAMSWNEEESVLTIGGARANVQRARIRTHGRSTLLSLECSRALQWRLERPATNRVRLILSGGVLARGAVADVGGHGLIRNVSGRQEEGRVVLDVAVLALASDAQVSTTDGGRTIVLALEEGGSGLPAPPVRSGRAMSQPDAFAAPQASVRTVVIDPGHGGHDPGVVSSRDRKEKDLVLELSKDLKDILENAGFSVVLTRNGDDDRGPDQRAERANMAGGDLFISLHAGAWFSRDRRGATAWTLPQGPASGSGDFIAWETVQQRHLPESTILAEMILARLSVDGGLQVHDSGTLEATVLRGVNMPAVLVEVGLLTHPGDEDLLRERDSRRRIAGSLANAVKAYRTSASERRSGNGGG